MSKLKFNTYGNPEKPILILGKQSGEKIGLISNETGVAEKHYLNSRDELNFTIHKTCDGKVYPYWEELLPMRKIWNKDLDIWYHMDIDLNESDETTKNIYCVSNSEWELSNTYVHNLEINTESDILRDDYSPTVFYSDDKNASLLDRILTFAPQFSVKYVDPLIKNVQRTFNINGKTVYDALNEVAEEVGLLIQYNSGSTSDGKIERSISVFDLKTACRDCGHRGTFDSTCPKCGSKNIRLSYGNETNIILSTEDLIKSSTLKPLTDELKNCFRLTSGDEDMDAAIINSNPNGSRYLWNFTDSMKRDMSQELSERLQDYFDQYQFFENSYSSSFNVTLYNNLIKKYKVYRNDLKEIGNSIIGYQNLMNAIYDVIDFNQYLSHELMPVVSMETDASKQVLFIQNSGTSIVGIQTTLTPAQISKQSADNAALDMAKSFVDKRYQVKIVNSSYTAPTWTGVFSVTNTIDEEDTLNTSQISYTITNDYEQFVKQKIDKLLLKDNTENLSISSLFKKDLNLFKAELKKYGKTMLDSFAKSCESALGIMQEMGISNPNSAVQSNGKDMYNQMYLPYLQKRNLIETELSLREDEISVVEDLYQKMIDRKMLINDRLNINKIIGEDLMSELYSFKLEGEYNNSNYISDGLSNAELFANANEFISIAEAELLKAGELRYQLSSNLIDLLLLEEFQPIVDDFELGNFIRINVDGKIHKVQLLSYEITHDDLSHISVEFSEVILSRNHDNIGNEIISQAQSMAKSFDAVKNQAYKGNEAKSFVNDLVNKGLDLTTKRIVNVAENQTQSWDENGMLFREYDPILDSYSDEQLKIINSTLAVTDDNWLTSKAAIGRFWYIDPKDEQEKQGYGVIADLLVGNHILSEDAYIYNENLSMSIGSDGIVINTNGNDDVNTMAFTIQRLYTDSDGVDHIDKQLWIDENGFIQIDLTKLVINMDDVKEAIDLSVSTKIEVTADGIRQEVKETLDNFDLGESAKLNIISEVKTTYIDPLTGQVDELSSTAATAIQNSEKFQWLVKSGTSESDFVLTDRTLELVLGYINLKGLVEFSGLNNDAKININNSVWNTDNGKNATDLYSMVSNWTDGAVSSTTKINGGFIETNTIHANAIAVGDFTNYAIVNERDETTMLPSSFMYGGTKIGTYEDAPYFYRYSNDNKFLMLSEFRPLNFDEKEKFSCEFEVFTVDTNTRYSISLWIFDLINTAATKEFKVSFDAGYNLFKKVNLIIDPDENSSLWKTAKYYMFGFTVDSTSQFAVRNVKIIRMVNNLMIVDGLITADKVLANAITADLIQANAITTEKLAIGDFNNYATVSEKIPLSIFKWYKIVESPTMGNWLEHKEGGGADFLWVCDYTVNRFQVNTTLKFSGGIWSQKEQTVAVGIWFYDEDKVFLDSGYWRQVEVPAGGSQFTRYKEEVKITEIPSNAYYYLLGYRFEKYGTDCRNAIQDTSVYKMTDSDLIVNGGITAEKLSAGAVAVGNLSTEAQNLINTAKSTAESAQSTANTALSTASSASSTANLAKTAADQAKSDASSALSTANNTSLALAGWCYENDTTYIDGGKIYTGTITAEKIAANAITAEKLALGGLDNYATVLESQPESIKSYTYKIIKSDSMGDWIEQTFGGGASILWMTQYKTPNTFVNGDVLRVKCGLWTQKAQTANIGIWIYNASNTLVGGLWKQATLPAGGSKFTQVEEILKLGNISADATYYRIGVQFAQYGESCRNAIQKAYITKVSGRLEVGDGFIDSSGSFKIGSMESFNQDDPTGSGGDDVLFGNSISVLEGIELYGSRASGGTISYIDFNNEDGAKSDKTMDFTGRISHSKGSGYTFEFFRDTAYGSANTNYATLRAQSISQTSDERLKHDIKPLDSDFCENLISSLQCKEFSYNGEEGKHYGFIAQEVKELIPEDSMIVPSINKLTDFYAMNYVDYIAPMVKVIQNLMEENKKLSYRIEWLESKIN